MSPGSHPCHCALYALPAVICKFWHVLHIERRRLCANGTRTDVAFSSSPSSSSPASDSRAGMIDTEQLAQPIGERRAVFA